MNVLRKVQIASQCRFNVHIMRWDVKKSYNSLILPLNNSTEQFHTAGLFQMRAHRATDHE